MDIKTLVRLCTCSICRCTFRDPRIFPCQHIFCYHCILNTISFFKNNHLYQFPCPTCREEISLVNHFIDRMPTSTFMVHLLSYMPDDQKDFETADMSPSFCRLALQYLVFLQWPDRQKEAEKILSKEECFQLLQSGVLTEYPESLYYSGVCYATGCGTVQDGIQAFHLFQKARDKDFHLASLGLGYCYAMGFGTEVSYGLALQEFLKNVDSGIANYNIGSLHYHGKLNGTPDYLRAKLYFKDAYSHYCNEGSYVLGYMCYMGQDYAEALQNFHNGRQSDHFGSSWFATAVCQLLSLGVKGLQHRGNEYMYEAAKKEHPKALNYCGTDSETIGEYKKAYDFYVKSANRRCVIGQYNLARCFYKGIGTTVNSKKAQKWFEKASEQGDLISTNILQDKPFFDRNVKLEIRNDFTLDPVLFMLPPLFNSL